MKTRKTTKGSLERRDFLKILSLTGVGGLIAPKNTIASALVPDATSKVVVVTDTRATDKTAKTVDADVVQVMVNEGVMNYTGQSTVGAAWKSLFPGISKNSIIGLKVNTLFSTRNTGTHPQVAYAVAEGLKQMDFSGTPYPENNIIIFDFHQNYLISQGYTINTGTTGIRCFPSSQYSSYDLDIGGVNVKLSKIITETINYMVNIAYLKQHFLSGVSLCLKNHYGSIQNPEISPLMHDSSRYGSPYIAAINALEQIRTKQKFCIIDSLFGVTSNGPSGVPTVIPDKLIMGQDIVAVDYTGRELLKTLGLTTLQTDKTVHIEVASQTYSLGNCNPAYISVVDVDTSSLSGEHTVDEDSRETFRNTPNPFHSGTDITFMLQKAARITLTVYAYNGSKVRQLASRRFEEGSHTVTWDGLDASGNEVPEGVYLCALDNGTGRQTLVMQKFKS